MDTVEVVPADAAVPGAVLRCSTRQRRKPTYFTPGGNTDPDPEDDVKFLATVTGAKGIKDFAENVNFRGTSNWRLNQILRRLLQGLKVDSKFKYIWTVWSEKNQSESHAEWERLISLSQIKSKEACKLRLYKQKKQPIVAKRPEAKEEPKALVKQPMEKPPPLASVGSALSLCPSSMQMGQAFPQQYPMMMMSPEMLGMCMAMCYSYPWMYFPYQ